MSVDNGDATELAAIGDTQGGADALERIDENLGEAERFDVKRIVIYVVVPVLALLLASVAAFFKYQEVTLRGESTAGIQVMQTAKDATVALLSYEPKSADETLGAAARDLLTGDFKDAYTKLITDVVVPGAEQKQISAVATVPAVSLASIAGKRAVVLAFVNQTTVISDGAPTVTASTIKLTLDEVEGHWLVSQFEPV